MSKELRARSNEQEVRNTQHATDSPKHTRCLSKIYHWFTEGFDTKDLQEAKTLLDEL